MQRKNKTLLGVIGVILSLFGIIGSIPILLNKEFVYLLPIMAISVIIGIILIAKIFSD